jgi:hypothetical protein
MSQLSLLSPSLYFAFLLCYVLCMKVSISLTGDAAATLRNLVERFDSKPSSVVEAAIVQLAALPEPQQARLIRESDSNKKAYTRSRWRTTFWAAMRDEFGINLKLRAPERDFAPQTYQGFDIVFLFNSLNDLEPEDGAFIVHIMKSPHLNTSGADVRQTFYYPRVNSPYDAAHKTAEWIQNHTKMRWFVLLDDQMVCCNDGHPGPEQCTAHLTSDRPLHVVEADGNGKFTNSQSLLIQAARPGESAGHIMGRVPSPVSGKQLSDLVARW